MLDFTHGDMFDVAADIRVNTVNCVGVMGAGVALAFKQRYPEMFKHYQRDCRDGRVRPGHMHVWKSLSGDWIVNFPTKRDWRDPSRYEDIDAGLDNLRSYLDTVRGVTVTLPALGCGHGGLDWARVSKMIRDKLDGVDAHVLIFEPHDSRRAGRTAPDAPTDDESARIADLGYRTVASDELAGLTPAGPAYTTGKRDLFSHKWIALLPSRAPAERETQALHAIAGELARSQRHPVIAFVHATRASEDIALLFAQHGIKTVILLPFGVLTRKSQVRLPAGIPSEMLTIASTAPANAKWSRQLLAQSMDTLRMNAAAMLLSDPEPDWLTDKVMRRWTQVPASYIRYETTSHQMQDYFTSMGARPIGRRSDTGAPNIDHLNAVSGDGAASSFDEVRGDLPHTGMTEPEAPKHAQERASDEVVVLRLEHPADAAKRSLFDILMRLDVTKLDLTLELAADVDSSDVLELRRLGIG